MFATELLFGRALQRGQTLTMTYRLDWGRGGPGDTSIDRRMRGGLRNYLLEVEFTDTIPDRVHTIGASDTRQRSVDFDGRVHLLVENCGPGSQVGLSWFWSAPQDASAPPREQSSRNSPNAAQADPG